MGALKKDQILYLRDVCRDAKVHPKLTSDIEETVEKLIFNIDSHLGSNQINIFPNDVEKRRKELLEYAFAEIVKVIFSVFVSGGKISFNILNPIKLWQLGSVLIRIILRIKKFKNGF